MRLYCSFPGNLGLLWSKGDHCLLGSQWQVLGALEGQSLGYYERPHFPRLITASLFHSFRKSGPYVLIQDKPCFFIKLILLNSQEMLPKKKKKWSLRVIPADTLQQGYVSESSLFANSCGAKPKFLGEIPFQRRYSKSL